MLNRTMCVLASIGIVTCARAELKTFDANGNASGDFDEPSNWDPTGVPDADDRIIILGGKTCNVTEDAEVDTLEIQEEDGIFIGVLDVKNGVTLTLDNNNHNCPSPGPTCQAAPQHSIVDGELFIRGDTGGGDSILEIVNATHEFSGIGVIWGAQGDELSHIVIATDIKLVNKMSSFNGGIRGGMTITGETGGSDRGVLRNEGILSTESAAVFPVADDIIIDAAIEDSSSAVWVTDCTGIIEFNHGNVDMQGLFSDNYRDYGNTPNSFKGGALKFHETVRTCGDYERDGCGGLTFVAGAEFKYTGFTGSCDNPDTDGTSSDTPNNCSATDQFYEVSEDEPTDDCE